MTSSMIARGNLLIDTVFGLVMTPPASIVATALTTATYTVQGLQVGDLVDVYVTSTTTTYSVTGAYVSAANTMTVFFASETGGTVSSSPAVNVVINWQRYEQTSFSQLPTNAL